jgi:hypothetical protein
MFYSINGQFGNLTGRATDDYTSRSMPHRRPAARPLLLGLMLLLSSCTPTADTPAPAAASPAATPTALQLGDLPQRATATAAAATEAARLAAPTATPTPEPTVTTTPQANPDEINGIPLEALVVMPAEVEDNVRQVYAAGQRFGRDAHAFSKLGDSLIATPGFLAAFDTGPYELGIYSHLQPVIDHYAGSFERFGVAVHAGLHSWGIFDPIWAPKEWCSANEDIVACELRLNNPSVLLILLGSNDSGSPGNFEFHVRRVAEVAMQNGVIPVLVTKADRFEGPDNVNNEIITRAAAEMSVPLWDFDRLAATLPGRGLGEDQIHLTPFPSGDYALPAAFQSGEAVHNLTALVVLKRILLATGQLEG